MTDIVNYYQRVLQWYTQGSEGLRRERGEREGERERITCILGGFEDEYGIFHSSDHYYSFQVSQY